MHVIFEKDFAKYSARYNRRGPVLRHPLLQPQISILMRNELFCCKAPLGCFHLPSAPQTSFASNDWICAGFGLFRKQDEVAGLHTTKP